MVEIKIHRCLLWQQITTLPHPSNEIFVDFSNYFKAKQSQFTINHPSLGAREAYNFMRFSQKGIVIQNIVQDLMSIANRNQELSVVHVFVDDKTDDNLLQLMLRATFYSGGVSNCACGLPSLTPLPTSPFVIETDKEGGLLGLGENFDFGLFQGMFSSVRNVLGTLSEGEIFATTTTLPGEVQAQYENIRAPDNISCIWNGDYTTAVETEQAEAEQEDEDGDVEEFGESYLENLSVSAEKKNRRRFRGKRGGGKHK